MKAIRLGGTALITLLLAAGPLFGQQGSAGPDWRTRSSISFVTNGSELLLQTNTVVFLAGGMNRWDAGSSDWIPCAPELTVAGDGVVGRGGRHEVHFAGNINSAAATQIRMPGGQWLKTHILGLFYEDTAARTNLLIADLQDSPPQVLGPDVWYHEAFSGIKADVRYSYTRSGVSQEIHIRERLPDPAAYGMSPASVQLIAITEIAEGPEPQIEERSWQTGQLAERDQCLDFGTMRMVPGLAFLIGSTADDEIAVKKEYRVVDGRRLILDRVRLGFIREQLLKLPAMNSSTNGMATVNKQARFQAQGELPPPPHGSAVCPVSVKRTGFDQGAAFVMDWDLVHSALANFTFHPAPNISYVVDTDTRLGGTTTINPGAVLRFASGSLYLDGPLNLPDAESPGALPKPVLTSMEDASVGPALRRQDGPRLGQYVPGLVVRAQDYTNALRGIRARHPAARVVPDRPVNVPHVRIERAAHQQGVPAGQSVP